jgi:AcrR family transcriptional regulator
VPKLWNETVEAHRAAVRDAILDTAASLVTERGLASVTMSEIATRAGIGRATLYKYFPDVDAILVAWHDRHVAAHLGQLSALAAGPGEPGKRLKAVLEAYATIVFHRGRQGADLSSLVHRGEHIADAQRQLVDLFRGLLAEAAASGDVRGDSSTGELAAYCLHALAAAGELPSQAAVRRLVDVTLTGLRPPA